MLLLPWRCRNFYLELPVFEDPSMSRTFKIATHPANPTPRKVQLLSVIGYFARSCCFWSSCGTTILMWLRYLWLFSTFATFWNDLSFWVRNAQLQPKCCSKMHAIHDCICLIHLVPGLLKATVCWISDADFFIEPLTRTLEQ